MHLLVNLPYWEITIMATMYLGKAKPRKNMNQLLSYLNDMGFQVLLNEAKPLKKDKDEIALIGVENWGAGGFKKNGDFDKASSM